jgi:integrase
MLTYPKSNEFRYYRDLSIVWLARNSNLPVQQILQKKLGDFEEMRKFFTTDLLDTYKSLLINFEANEPWLFPTDDGRLYMPGKFSQNIQRMLKKAGMPSKPNHPNKMSQAQVEALLGMQFSYERPLFQQTLIGALLGVQALRPEEIAKLRKQDIDLDRQTILLQLTKSQVQQLIPLHRDLVTPFTKYLAHFKTNEALFVRSTGKQWNRKDVHQAIAQVASECGLKNITPRRLRSTVGHEMMLNGVRTNEISLILRHSDEATTARHYLHLQDLADARNVLNNFHPAEAKVA